MTSPFDSCKSETLPNRNARIAMHPLFVLYLVLPARLTARPT